VAVFAYAQRDEPRIGKLSDFSTMQIPAARSGSAGPIPMRRVPTMASLSTISPSSPTR
jgi:hypothetical protein